MTLQRKQPPRREATQSSYRPDMAPARSVMVPVARPTSAATARVMPKTPDRVQQAIRDAARDELCTVRLPGCPGDPAMSIWSHNRHQRAGKGKSIKALDLNGCIACTFCDAIYDGQRPRPAGMTAEAVELAWYHGHAESLVRLRQKGLV